MRLISLLIVTPLFLLAPVVELHAQIPALDRGSILLAGSASFTSTGWSDDDDRITEITLSPAVQYFLIPGLAVGGEVLLAYYSEGDFSSSNIGAGPAVTYFFGTGNQRIAPFVSANLLLYRSSTDSGFEQNKETTTGYRGSGGVLFMLSQSVGLTGELFYQGRKNSDDFDLNTYGLAFGVSAFVF